MAEKKSVDLVNGPVNLARQLANVQNTSFRGAFLPEPVNPLVDVLRQHGLTLKGLKDGNT